MKIFNKKSIQMLAILLLTFGLQNCATKKNTSSNKIFVVKSNKDNNISDKNILYIVDGKEVSANFINELDSSYIEKMTVLKGNKEVAKHTDKEYEGVIIIEMKKQ